MLHTTELRPHHTDQTLGDQVNAIRHSVGEPLDSATKSVMESGFGHDFSGVRLHRGARAAEAAGAIGAAAFTHGRDVVLPAQHQSPRTPDGMWLLAHELAHVVQQTSPSTPSRGPRLGQLDSPLEREADGAADAVTSGSPVSVGRGVAGSGVVQRQPVSPEIRTPAPGTPAWQAAVAKAENDKLGDESWDAMKKAALEYAIEREPLKGMIAKGKAFATTPGGAIAIAEAVTMLITGFVLAHHELMPVTSHKFDLGMVSKQLTGISVTPTWKGPANDPTEAAVKLEMAPEFSPFSVSAGFKTGSKTPSTFDIGAGYKPGRVLPGLSIAAGVSVAERSSPLPALDPRVPGARVEGSATAKWTMPSGPFAGGDLSSTAKLDDAGNKSIMFNLTIPLGSKAKPH
jgi:Domain of unknown function (DUF4157)